MLIINGGNNGHLAWLAIIMWSMAAAYINVIGVA